jgi:hypothetical protein
MNTCPVTDPSAVEKRLFDAGLIERVPLAETYDVKAGTSAQRASIDPQVYRVKRDVHNPDGWGNELWANMRWEWFAHALQPGGLFAFEQWPADPDSPPRERILWFIDGGPPIVHYNAGQGLWDRSYFVYLNPDSAHGRRIAELATRMSGLLSGEQREACQRPVLVPASRGPPGGDTQASAAALVLK